ncbi:MAG: spermidine synthase [Pseudomonadota bacterium]
MQPWTRLAEAAAPDGDVLRLLRRGDEFSIRIAGGNELMNSRLGGSEEALATLALDRLAGRPALRVLIGGLGMGFTLRAALARGGPDLRVETAEIVPELIAWARGPMAPVFQGALDDPRADVLPCDVAALIDAATGAYDAILLDVDNGPDGLTRPANGALYAPEGLASARRALRPGGVLAVWSAAPDRAFEARLRAAGFAVETHAVRARKGAKRGPRHTIWLGRAPSG